MFVNFEPNFLQDFEYEAFPVKINLESDVNATMGVFIVTKFEKADIHVHFFSKHRKLEKKRILFVADF